MGWVKLDDQFFRHPKVVGAGRDARLLYLAALCYAGSNLTDGLIPGGAVRVLAAEVEIRNPTSATERLVEVGLWEQEGDVFRIHDYLDFNRSSERVRAERDAAAERMKRHRSPNVRANIERSAVEVCEQDTDTDINAANAAAKPPLAPTKNPTNGRSQPTSVNASYALFSALCDEIGADEAAATEGEKKKQLGIAKQLLADGVTEADVRGCARYLQSQSWRTGFIDMATVRSEIGKWRMAGCPDREPTPLRPPKPRVATL